MEINGKNMQDTITSLVGLNQSSKIHSIQNLKCNICNGKDTDAIIVIFDDGHISVSCPGKSEGKRCQYEIPARPIRWHNQRWLLYVFVVIIFLVTIIYQLIKDGIIKL